jgi:hypothetical protein
VANPIAQIRARLRALRKTPAFTAGAIATIALTVGTTTAIFSVVGEGARFILIGLISGVAIAAGLARLVSTMLFGVTSGDVATFVQASAIVAVVSLLACAVPTYRALRLGGAALHAE